MKNIQEIYQNCKADLQKYNAGSEAKTVYTVEGNNLKVSQINFNSEMTVEDFETSIRRNKKFEDDASKYDLDERYTIVI